MIDPPEVHRAGPAERGAALGAIVLGFATDPFNRWLFPDGARYLAAMPAMADAFGGRAFDSGTAFVAAAGSGAALWLPPGVEPDRERMLNVLFDNVEDTVAAELAGVGAGMADYHERAGHCWYLPLIGVDPLHQGRGIGARLMVEALRLVDADGAPAYLESSNPRNVSLYRRHGFEVMGEIRVGGAPPMVPMLRPPRR